MNTSYTEGFIGLQNAGIDTSKTLWMGEVDEPFMDEQFISSLFSGIGATVNVKVVRDRNTGLPAGYCFIDFPTHETAERVLHAYNGLQIPNTTKKFSLNWAQYGQMKASGVAAPNYDQLISEAPVGYDNSLFVSELDPNISNTQLFEVFSMKIPGVISARVVTDPITGRSKGVGFVKFATTRDCQRALVEIQGSFCGTKIMRLSPALPKSNGAQYNQQGSDISSELYSENFIDASGCTLFVQGLTQVYSSEEALRGFFTQFGEVGNIKILNQQSVAFVRFSSRVYADKAISHMNDLQRRGETSVLNWIKVGPTFNLKQQISQSNSSGGGGQLVEIVTSKKDIFMRKQDVVELNLDFASFHCPQFFELTKPEFLFL